MPGYTAHDACAARIATATLVGGGLALGMNLTLCAAAASQAPTRDQIDRVLTRLLHPDEHTVAVRELRRLGAPIAHRLASEIRLERADSLSLAVRDEAILLALVTFGEDAADLAPWLADQLARPIRELHHGTLLRLASSIAPYVDSERDYLRQQLVRFRRQTSVAHPEYFRAVSRYLFAFAPDPQEVIDGLCDDNAFIRELCAELVVMHAAGHPEAIEQLAACLNSEHHSVVRLHGHRWSATLAADFTPYVRPAAARALTALAAEHPSAIGAHIFLATDPDPRTRRDAVMALGRFGPAAAAATPILRQALDDPYLAVACEAITSLGMLGNAAESALPDLRTLRLDLDRQVVRRADAAIRQIEKQ